MYPIYHTEDRNIPFITEVTGTVTILEGSPEDIADHGIDILSMSVVSRYEKVGFDFGNVDSCIDNNNKFKMHFKHKESNYDHYHRTKFTKDFCQNISEVIVWCVHDKVTLKDISVDISSLTFTFSDGTDISVNPDILISRNNSYLYEKYYN